VRRNVARFEPRTALTDARLQTLVEKAFEERGKITPETTSDVRDTVGAVLHDAKARGKRSQEKGFRTSSDGNFWKSRSFE
jgi:hypothetical protein